MSSPQRMYSPQPTPPPRRHGSFEEERTPKKSPLLKSQEAKVGKYTKAWTLEEERILLQSRVERIPYKQIAVRLGKTDLACRLHYHQMVMAKRTPQTQPGRSIVFLSSEHPPEIHRLAPSASTSSTSSSDHDSFLPAFNGVTDTGDYLVVPLPKNAHRRTSSLPRQTRHAPLEIHRRETSPMPATHHARHRGSSVDISRLQHLYKEYSGDLWANIAAAYSQEERVTATELESAFLAANGPSPDMLPVREPVGNSFSLPPIKPSNPTYGSMNTSPRSGSSSPEHHQLSRPQHYLRQTPRCSVESLLNHASRDNFA